MSTPTSRLADLVRRRRGMPTMDFSADYPDGFDPTAVDAPTEDPERLAAIARGDDPSFPSQLMHQESQGRLTAVAKGDDPSFPSSLMRGATPDGVSPQPSAAPQPSTPVVKPPPSRHARLMAAINRTAVNPELNQVDAPALADDQTKEPVAPAQNSIPAMAAKTIMGAALPRPPSQPPPPIVQPSEADTGLNDAREADRQSRFTAAMELAARQLVGGVTRTSVPQQGVGAAPSQVPAALEAAAARRKSVADALNRKRQETLDASKLSLEKSETDKNNRPPVEKAPSGDPLEQAKLDETIRHNMATETNTHARAVRGAGTHGGGVGQSDDEIAKATAAYQLAPPSPRQKNYSELMTNILKIDPTYDASRFATYQHTRENQATNPSLMSGKAVKHHMDELQQAVDELSAGRLDSPLANKAAQAVDEATGAGKYTRLKTAASVVGSELAQALGDKDMAGREHVARLVDPTQTKAQWAKSLPELVRLRDEKIGVSDETLRALGPTHATSPQKPSPGAGYVRGKVNGKPGWINKAAGDWEPD